jgi:hypothetical protein
MKPYLVLVILLSCLILIFVTLWLRYALESRKITSSQLSINYTVLEELAYQAIFKQVIKRYYWACVQAGFLGFGLVVILTLAFKFPDLFTLWIILELICIFLLLGIVLTIPLLTCPRCHNRLVQNFDVYCPTCGSNQIYPYSLFCTRLAYCSSCNRHMSPDSKSGRNYRIRFCTSCGLLLDDKGF